MRRAIESIDIFMRTHRYYIAKWDAVLQKSHGASDEKNARRAAQRRDASTVGDLAEKQKKAKHRSASLWQMIDYVPGTRMVAALCVEVGSVVVKF